MRQINPYIFGAGGGGGGDLFADAFDDAAFDTGKWVRRHNDANITLTETNHLLFTNAGGNVAINDAIDSIGTFDFTNRTMDFYIDTILGIVGLFFVVGIVSDPPADGNNRASFVMVPTVGSVDAIGQTRIGGSNSNTSAANWATLGTGGRINYYRIKHDAGPDNLNYYWSNDGVTYTLLATYANFAANFGSLAAVHAVVWDLGGGDALARDAFIKDLRVY